MEFLRAPVDKTLGRLAATTVFVAVPVLVTSRVFDPDLFWHLANGRASLEQGRIVSEEIFSYTVPGAQFVNHKWLGQILLFLVYDRAGLFGLAALKAAIALAVSILSFRTARAFGASSAVASLVVLTSLSAALPRYLVRPEAFSFLLTAALIWILFGVREKRLGPAWLWLVPPSMVVWDWLHGAVYGLAVLLLFSAAEFVKGWYYKLAPLRSSVSPMEPPRQRALAMALVVTLAAMAVNPFGLRGYLEYRLFFGDNLFAQSTYELLPAWHWGLLFTAFWLLLGLVAAALLGSWQRIDLTMIALAVPFGYLAVRHVRVTAIFAIVVVPILAVAGSDVGGWWRRRRQRPVARMVEVGLFVTALLAALAPKAGPSGSPLALGHGLVDQAYPVGAARFVAEVGLEGDMFNPGHMGGYLAWKLYPQRRIFLYNEPTLFLPVMQSVREGQYQRQYQFDYAVVENEHVAAEFLERGDWVLLHWDLMASVVARRGGRNQRFIDRHEKRLFMPWTDRAALETVRSNPENRVLLLSEIADLLRFRRDPQVSDVFVALATASGEAVASAKLTEWTLNALEANPDDGALWALAAGLYRRAGDDERALAAERAALRAHDGFVRSRVLLGHDARRRGDLIAATRLFGVALARDPASSEAWYGQGQVAFALRRWGEAARAFRRFETLAPGGPWAQRARDLAAEADRRK